MTPLRYLPGTYSGEERTAALDGWLWHYNSSRQVSWFAQLVPAEAGDGWFDPAAGWKHYWGSPASYPDRSGDLRSVITVSDFYSARQWHSTGFYHDACRPYGIEHEMMLCLPAGPGRTAAVTRAFTDPNGPIPPDPRPGPPHARPRAHGTGVSPLPAAPAWRYTPAHDLPPVARLGHQPDR